MLSSMPLHRLALCGLLLLPACQSERGAVPADPARVQAHVEFLADDLLEGREAGTRGYELAARYVASQFQAQGLQPGGDDGGWLQRVPLLQAVRLREGARFELQGGAGDYAFEFEREFLPGVDFDTPDWSLTAPLVFVGQAVVAPEFGHDDLAGVEVRGKIAVLLSGAPARFDHDARAFYSSSREKLTLLADRGAAAVVWIGDPKRESRAPWARGAANWARPSMRRVDANGFAIDSYPSLLAGAALSAEAARRLFAGAPQSADDVFAHLDAGTLRPFDLPGTATLAGRAQLQRLDSHNVVARLPGADPQLAKQHVVYTAHLDHIGIGAPVNGDAIYNGALDNALGVALLLETARLAKQHGAAARGQLFVALTAEEKGLLGAEHFAEHPGIEGQLVANINLDMPVILSPQRDVLPIGIEHSSLKPVVEAMAAKLDVKLSADPFPEEVVFIRSDQYAFIRRGIPAVYLDGGIESSDPAVDGRAQLQQFLREHYHQPSDESDLPIHYPSAARLADLNHAIGRHVASETEAPRWNPGDFFGERFARDRD